MNTLFDFITQVKGVEYLIAVAAIGAFLILVEVLKPQPFGSMIDTAREDLREINQTGGYPGVARTLGRVVAAPFIGLGYIIALPFVFLFAVNLVLVEGVARAIDVAAVWMGRMIITNGQALTKALGAQATFGWRPQESYFLGRKRRKAGEKEKKEEEQKEEPGNS